MSLIDTAPLPPLNGWPLQDFLPPAYDTATSELAPARAHREWIARRARLHLAAFLAEEAQGEPLNGHPMPVEASDDIDFGRSDCEFLFRD
jgi:hypothetical protein